MGGQGMSIDSLGSVDVTAVQARAAAVHVADRIAAQHPHPLDDLMPRLAGRQTAQNPGVQQEVLDLLAAIGLLAAATRRRP